MTDVTFYNKTGADGKFEAQVQHGSTAGTARPSTSLSVMWVGTVTPTNAVNGDTYLNTGTGDEKVMVSGSFIPLNQASNMATYAGLWQSQTPYTAGQIVRDKFGYMLIASAGFTSALTYSAIEAANWKDVSGKVSPKRFGASGGGTVDDTAPIQAALNCAVSFGCALMVDDRYKTTANLVLPVGSGAVTILGNVADSNPFGSLSLDKASIESTGSAVFTQSGAGNVQLVLRDVNFRNNGASSAVIFSGVTLNTSTVVGNSSAKYAYAFDATSNIVQVSRVNGNRFENNGTVFCAASVVDSYISENYLNGDPGKNATCFSGTIATSVISNNYVDFFKRVFDVPQGNKDVRVEGNIFDYCWCTFGSSSGQNLGSFSFVGNTWDHCTAAAALPHYTSPDSDMTGTPWRAIDAGSNALTNVTVVGNNVVGVDGFIRALGGVGALRESGNIYDGGYQTGLITVQPAFYSATPADIILEALNNNLVTPTFSATQTIDWSQGGIQVVTLTANMTSLTFSNPIKNTVYRLRLIQDATGKRTWAGLASNIKMGGVPQLSAPASAQDVFTFFYDGTNYEELSRTMNDGSTVYTPMGSLWQLSSNGQTDWFNSTSDAYPQVRISPVFNQGPGTYGSILFGRGNVSPDASLARGNDNQACLIANAPWLKKVSTQTLAANGGVTINAYTADTHRITLQANATSFTIATPATSTGWAQQIRITLIQDATGSRTWVAPTNVKWAGGSAPVLTTTANHRDTFEIEWDAVAGSWFQVGTNVG